MTLCDKGGREPKFCDITFHKEYEGDIIRINQIEKIPLKTLNNLTNIHVMIFNVHLCNNFGTAVIIE